MNNQSLPIIGPVVEGYKNLMALGDPRVEGLFLMDGPLPITAICLAYMYFVLSLGPRLMADKKAYNLKHILLLYNAGQTIFSTFLFFLGLKHWIKNFGWGLSCYPVNHHLRTPDEMLLNMYYYIHDEYRTRLISESHYNLKNPFKYLFSICTSSNNQKIRIKNETDPIANIIKLEQETLKLKRKFKTVKLCHIYFLSKITELADTVFFVLKKKQNHISLLHVFHHAAMPFSVWFGVKFHPGGNMAFFGLPNLFVHMWMYLYYFLAALGPKYQKYIWWKRHITQMQLAQFLLVMLYYIYISLRCKLNKTLFFWAFSMDIAFVILFSDFYWKTYLKKKTTEKTDNASSFGEIKSSQEIGKMGNSLPEKMNGFYCQKEDSCKKKDL